MDELLEWQLVSLEIEGASGIEKVLTARLEHPILEVPVKRVKNPSRQNMIEIFEELPLNKGKKLTIYNSGYYHHYTYGLCWLIGKEHKDYCYIHIDNHDDLFCFTCDEDGRSISCESFVLALVRDCNVGKLITVGKRNRLNSGNYICRDDVVIINYKQLPKTCPRTIKNLHRKVQLENLFKNSPKEVYVSVDLDITPERVIQTSDFSRGDFELSDLITIINFIKQKKNIIGADILGYNPVGKIGKSIYSTEKAFFVYSTLITEIIDK